MRAVRKYHRWVGLVAGFFFLIIAGTGLGLHIDQTIGTGEFARGPTLPPKPVRTGAQLPTVSSANAFVANGLRNIEARHAGLRVLEVHSNYGGRTTKGYALMSDPRSAGDKPLRIDLTTGASLADPPELGGKWHLILQEIHAGRQFGWAGAVVSILSGLGLPFLAASGLWLYTEMYRRRWKARKKALFWDL